MNSVMINCGNGGDWEFENERIYWVVWIKKNICAEHFKVFSKAGIPADKAMVSFADPKMLTLFILKAPELVPVPSREEIDQTFNGRDALRAYR